MVSLDDLNDWAQRAALQVLALEKEMGVRGMGEALADFAADLNLHAFREPPNPDYS